MFEKRLPYPLVLLISAILIVNFLAVYFSWYWRVPWLDMAMHFSGGFWAAGILVWVFSYWSGPFINIFRRKEFRNIGVVLIGVIVIGLLWEVYEYTADYFAGRTDYDIIDTISDLMLDLMGGTIAGFYFLKKENSKQEDTKHDD